MICDLCDVPCCSRCGHCAEVHELIVGCYMPGCSCTAIELTEEEL